jgi:hypothetical protein
MTVTPSRYPPPMPLPSTSPPPTETITIRDDLGELEVTVRVAPPPKYRRGDYAAKQRRSRR